MDHLQKNVKVAQLDNMQVLVKLHRAHVLQKDSINLKKVKQRVCFVCRVGIKIKMDVHLARDVQQIRILLYLVEKRHVHLAELDVLVKQQVLFVHRVHLGKNLLDKLYQQNQPMPLVVQDIHVQ